jgi:hypothetical protein
LTHRWNDAKETAPHAKETLPKSSPGPELFKLDPKCFVRRDGSIGSILKGPDLF